MQVKFHRCKRKAFIRTVEAVLAGAIIFISFSALSLQPAEISGLEAKKLREISSLLAVATISNASEVLIYGGEESSSELLKNMLHEYTKISFELQDIPKKDMRVGFWIDDFFERTTAQDPGCPSCPGLSGSCGTFQIDGKTACLKDYNYLYFDYSGDGRYDDERPVLLHQVFAPPESSNRYVWENYNVLGNVVHLNFMNISTMQAITERITGSFILNGRKSRLYFVPIYNRSDVVGLDAILIFNKTHFSSGEIQKLADFMREGGGVIWVSDVYSPSDAANMLELLGLRWVRSSVTGHSSDIIFNPRLMSRYTPTYDFLVYANSSLYGVKTVPVDALPPGISISNTGCIPNPDAARFGRLVLRGTEYPFLVAYDGASYSAIYVSYDSDLEFCEDAAEQTRIRVGTWFNLTDDLWVYFGDVDRSFGIVAYFGMNATYNYRDFADVGSGAAGKNRLYPKTNETAYVPLMLKSQTYEVDGITRNVAGVILNIVNGTSKVVWMPSSLTGHDEWKIVRDAIVWASRKKELKYGKAFKYWSEVSYPIIWSGNATLVGEAVVKIW